MASGTINSTTVLSRTSQRLGALLSDPGLKEVHTADVWELTRGGRLDLYNTPMQHGDVVFLTNYQPSDGSPTPLLAGRQASERLVRISGVPRGGTYALLPGEGLRKLLELSGFSDDPSLDLRNVLVERRDAQGDLARLVVNIDSASGGGERLDEVRLEHRDTVRILSYVSQVFVLGEVNMAGPVSYSQQLKLHEYLTQVQGAKDTANLKEVRIIRQKRDFDLATQQPQVFIINMIAEAKGEAQPNYEIRAGDVIFVPHKSRRFELRDLTGSLNTIFLGLNFFQDSNSTNPQPDPGV